MKEMSKKSIIVFVLAVVLLAILVWPRGRYRIASIENGNTVVLDNGTVVKLIGVYNTDDAKEFLEDNYLKTKVVLFSDASNAFNPNHLKGNEVVYAYVVQRTDAQCINSTLIRCGKTALNENSYLTDSLKSYRKLYEYAKANH